MKTNLKILIILMTSVLLACANGYSSDNADRHPPKEAWTLVSIQAEVESIDMETREISLRGPMGNLATLRADERVKRFAEIRAGDIITTDYWTYLKAEFRDPTPEEVKNPLVILSEGGKAPEGAPPGAVIGAIVQAVVTVERINIDEKQVTIKGPRGKFLTLPVEDKTLLMDMRPGETGIMTYAEGLAISLEKVKK